MARESLSVISSNKDIRFVHKANSLIQLNSYLDKKSKDSLSLTEAKLIAYALSELDPEDDALHPVTINIDMYWQMCGIAPTGSEYYAMIIEAIEKLVNRRTWVVKTDPTTGMKKATMVAWLDGKPELLSNRTCVIRFDPDLKPALLQLKDNYTKYPRVDVMRLQSKYGFALYELLCSMERMDQPLFFSLQDIAARLDATNYLTKPADLNKRVISAAVNDINNFSSSFSVSYTMMKTGRQFSHVAFTTHRITGQLTENAIRDKDQLEYEQHAKEVKEQISYDILLEGVENNSRIDKDFSRNTLNLILETMVEVLFYPKKTYRINQNNLGYSKIQERYRELTHVDIQFVLDSVYDTGTKIRSPIAYIRSALFNAKLTASMVIGSQVNSAMKAESGSGSVGGCQELGAAELEAIQKVLHEDVPDAKPFGGIYGT